MDIEILGIIELGLIVLFFVTGGVFALFRPGKAVTPLSPPSVLVARALVRRPVGRVAGFVSCSFALIFPGSVLGGWSVAPTATALLLVTSAVLVFGGGMLLFAPAEDVPEKDHPWTPGFLWRLPRALSGNRRDRALARATGALAVIAGSFLQPVVLTFITAPRT